MRVKAGIVIFISLLFLVGAVGAVIQVDVTGNSSWLVAGSGSSAAYTLTVKNITSNVPIQGANITFLVDPAYGTMNPAPVTTNSTGQAVSTFTVNTKSGTAPILASISYIGGTVGEGPFSINTTILQNIDHNTPYYDPSFSLPLFTYPQEGPVATEIPFKISMYDYWGNPIDNRRGNHTLGLQVSSPLVPDDCGFNDGGVYKHTISRPLEANGTLSVNVKLTTKIGFNYIRMDSIGDISFKTVSIKAVAAGNPFSMIGSISDGGVLPANGLDKFTIEYFLYDKYGNAMANRSIWIRTNVSGEQSPTLHTSDSNGLIRFYYGPKITVLTANITADAYDNASVTNEILAHFVNTGPTNMVLAVTPQTMASREVNPSQQAFVRATVIDLVGNPVPGETVTFDITSINYGGFNVSAVNGTPSFSGSSVVNTATAITDADGNAIVLFYPGSFPKRTEAGWSKSANASCTIEAHWNSTVTRTVKVTWKNYPYLSVEASTAPPTVRLNDTFDVNIRVTGDGYAMNGAPVTVILDEDCTANMFSNPDQPPTYPHRNDSAKAAGKVFVDQMKEGQDYVGFNSFGTKLNDKFDLPPQPSMDLVRLKLESLVKGTNAKDFVPSIFESMTNITVTQYYPNGSLQRPMDEVRAVIILHDAGASNVGSAEEDAIVAAALSPSPKIYLFTVLYYDGGSTSSSTEVTMRALADRTGGKFFKPSTPQELQQAYFDIAGILRNLAGVNASMQVNYQNVEVNSTPISGGLAFDYVPVENGMTSPDSRTTILWPNNTRSFKNQSDEWTAANNYQLHFDIGTMNISDRWETTYRLKANQTGLIRMFDNTSTILFNNGAETVEFPDLYITVTPNTTTPGLQTGVLSVTNLVPQSGNFVDSVPMQWNLNYTGFDTVTESYWYSYRGLPFVEFGRVSGIPSTNGLEISRSRTLDVTKFPPGDYRIQVIAEVPGISPADDFGAFIKPVENEKVNIWLHLVQPFF